MIRPDKYDNSWSRFIALIIDGIIIGYIDDVFNFIPSNTIGAMFLFGQYTFSLYPLYIFSINGCEVWTNYW